MLAPSFGGPAAGPDVREPAEPVPRPAADGAVERVRLDGAHHRQQERDGGRLLHDLRRLVGGYAVIKDVLKTRVYDLCRYVNRAAGRDVIPRGRDHQAAVRRAATRPARRPEPAAVRRARPDPRARTSRTIAPPAEIIELGHDEAHRASDHPPGRHRRVQAPSMPARRAGDRQGVRQGPPDADHERLPRLTSTSLWSPSSAGRGKVVTKTVDVVDRIEICQYDPVEGERVAPRCSTARSTRQRRSSWQPC